MNPFPTMLPVAGITPSPMNPRKRFPKQAQADLEASVLMHGILQPLLVRPLPEAPDGSNFYRKHELVAGERRFRAAQTAGLVEVPVLIRELTDDEVLHIQIIENMQREDLHPYEEAEQFQLLKDRGYSAIQIAAVISNGRGPAYVHQRLKLVALVPKARDAFLGGKVSSTIALYIARLPSELQLQALKANTAPTSMHPEGMTASQAATYIQHEFMLRLDEAPFKTSDADLVPAAGPCGSCPKRTGNQTELFQEVTSKDMCTDPTCFASKKAAAMSQKRAEAIARGATVISGKDAKKVKPSEYSSTLQEGWVALDDRCHEDPKNRTYRQLLGKTAKPALLEDPYKDRLLDVVQRADIKMVLADKGIKVSSRAAPVNAGEAAERKRQKDETAFRARLFADTRAKYLEDDILGVFDMKVLAAAFYYRLWNENQKRMAKLYGWGKGALSQKEFADRVDDIEREGGSLCALLLDMALINDSSAGMFGGNGDPILLAGYARTRGLDPTALRKSLQAEAAAAVKAKAKPVPAKKAPAYKPYRRQGPPRKTATAKKETATPIVAPADAAVPKLKKGQSKEKP